MTTWLWWAVKLGGVILLAIAWLLVLASPVIAHPAGLALSVQ